MADNTTVASRLYEEMHAITTEMVEAARTNRWHRVVELEGRASKIRSILETTDVSAIPRADLPRVSQLTRQIIENISEVNRHAGPWLGAMRKLLGAPTLKRRVQSAYRA
jgi:hypothetical protein